MKSTTVNKDRIGKESNHEQKPVAPADNALMFENIKNGRTRKFKVNRGIALTVAVAICTAVMMTSCNSPAENVNDAKEDVTQANKDLDKAREEYADEMEQFRIESDKRLTANERTIADIINNGKNKLSAEYEKQVAVLEQKNKDLKKRVKAYKADTKEDWLTFKTEFNKDMDELGVALENFVVDNNN